MKTLTLKAEKVAQMYNILGAAKYTELNNDDKVKVWKIARKMKPIADELTDNQKDAVAKFMPEGFQERLTKAQKYEIAKRNNEDNLPMTDEEYINVVNELREYNNLVTKAISEANDANVEIEIETISEDSFGKLMSSNEWTMEQTILLDDIVEN